MPLSMEEEKFINEILKRKEDLLKHSISMSHPDFNHTIFNILYKWLNQKLKSFYLQSLNEKEHHEYDFLGYLKYFHGGRSIIYISKHYLTLCLFWGTDYTKKLNPYEMYSNFIINYIDCKPRAPPVESYFGPNLNTNDEKYNIADYLINTQNLQFKPQFFNDNLVITLTFNNEIKVLENKFCITKFRVKAKKDSLKFGYVPNFGCKIINWNEFLTQGNRKLQLTFNDTIDENIILFAFNHYNIEKPSDNVSEWIFNFLCSIYKEITVNGILIVQ